ncbi:hypothetical protein [Paenibacillus alkaliterrae]|nr:hypothetical protein [Paenibacillus alkaliterrae]
MGDLDGDGDGKAEVVLKTALGHGDAMHVSDLNPFIIRYIP